MSCCKGLTYSQPTVTKRPKRLEPTLVYHQTRDAHVTLSVRIFQSNLSVTVPDANVPFHITQAHREPVLTLCPLLTIDTLLPLLPLHFPVLKSRVCVSFPPQGQNELLQGMIHIP